MLACVSFRFIYAAVYRGYTWLMLLEYSGLQAGTFKLSLFLITLIEIEFPFHFHLLCLICCFSSGEINFF